MRLFNDEGRKTQVLIADSLSELLEAGVDGRLRHQNGEEEPGKFGGRWYGRTFATPESAKVGLHQPWEEGMEMMDRCRTRLAGQLPEPESVRRRMRWNEMGGELATDRLLNGDPVMFRETRRTRMTAPKNVALLCNVVENCDKTPEQITWRGAAAIAATDLLEDAGYSVELWAWCRMTYAFDFSPNHHFYWACQLKGCGEPLDTDVLINGLSSWYMRLIILGAMHSMVIPWHNGKPSNDWCGRASHDHAGCDTHLDVTENITRIDMPRALTFEQSVASAKQVIEMATNRQEQEAV